MRLVVTLFVALILAVLTTLGVAWQALAQADRTSASRASIMVRGGTEAWLVQQHASFGLIWINCGLLVPPLVNPQSTVIDLPEWAIPPAGQGNAQQDRRVATLAVGWPMPFIARQWSTTSPSQLFPLPVDQDDGRDSLRRAAGRFRETDPALPRTMLWSGFAINIALFTLAWLLVLLIAGAALRRSSNGKQRNDDAHKQHEA